MIIIAENKQNHYLIKQFLIETNHHDFIDDLPQTKGGIHGVLKPSDLKISQNQGGVHTALNTRVVSQDTKIKNDDTLVDELIKKRPKFKGIRRWKMIPLIVLSLLYANNLDKAAIEMAKDQNQSHQAKVQPKTVKDIILDDEASAAGNEEENVIDYNTFIEKEEVIKSIIKHEGFRGLPYPDHAQWSVGHGTKVHSAANIGKGKHDELEKDYKIAKSKGTRSLTKWVEGKIPGWRKKFFAEYGVASDNKNKFDEINEEQAGLAAEKRIKQAIEAMQKIKYFDNLPSNVKRAFFDMAYNMGSGFINEFTKFDEAIRYSAIALNNSPIDTKEIEVANELFSIAADEILYNYIPSDKEGDLMLKIRGKTKYHKDLKKSGRPQKNAELVRQGISIEDLDYIPQNFQNESLKRVYSNLFT